MKIGRNFTNMLETSVPFRPGKAPFQQGELPRSTIWIPGADRAKRDIINQLKVGLDIGVGHIELDGASLILSGYDRERNIRRERLCPEIRGMTTSLHLPYTYVGAATCASRNPTGL